MMYSINEIFGRFWASHEKIKNEEVPIIKDRAETSSGHCGRKNILIRGTP